MMTDTKIFDLKTFGRSETAFLAEALLSGKTAVLPTDTVYGVVVCAKREYLGALNALKENPPDKPAQILCTKAQARVLALPGPALDAALGIWPKPLTAILPASPEGKVLSGLNTVGLRVPAGGFMADLFGVMGAPLYASSANMHSLPTLEREEDILDIFSGKSDIRIKGGFLKAASSCVADLSVCPPKIIREGGLGEREKQIIFSKIK